MNTKQWVQHISGQGEKWQVKKLSSPGDVNEELQWLVEDKGQTTYLYYLPKSEYHLCDPPEEWEDVTEHIAESSVPGNWMHGHRDMLGLTPDYRLRKVRVVGSECPKWAFTIERRKA